MKKLLNTNIKIKERLTQNDYDDIRNLEEICSKNDSTYLKLEIDYKLNRSKWDKKKRNVNSEFMFYETNLLIGYIGICEFGGPELEINGMVHPAFRKNGVFKKLFQEVNCEFNKRTCKKMLLLNDHNSLSGESFIKTTGAIYEFSEYEMHLNNIPNKTESSYRITLRKANNQDAREIALQNALYAGIPFEESQIILPEDEEKNGFVIFIAELDSKIIGKINLEINNGVGGIYGFGVRPEYRRKGYGREILIDSIKKLKKRNIKEVMLQVVTKNDKALNLYESCGFEVTSMMDYYGLTKL